MKMIPILLACVLMIGGCAASTYYRQSGSKIFPSESAQKVRILAGDPTDLKYEIIGSIAVDKPGEANDVIQLLKEKAAALGANAVIHARPTKMTSFTGSRNGISGVAVRIIP